MEKKVSFWRKLRIIYRKTIRPYWVDYKWIILAGTGLVIIVVGYIGFWLALGNKGYSWTDLFFLSLRLFLLQTASEVQYPPWPLQLARFAAPILGFFTIFFVILTTFYEQVWLAGLKYRKRSHAIVCGMGYIGPIIARRLLNQGYIVLVIDKDGTNPALDVARDMGALVLTGDATQVSTLEKAGIKNARYLFSLTGNDAQNIKIYMESLSRLNNVQEPFTWYTHIEDPGLFKLFASEVTAKFCPAGMINLNEIQTEEKLHESHFFNIYWIAASCLLKGHPIINDEYKKAIAKCLEDPGEQSQNITPLPDPPNIHLLIVGVGTFGESLILQAAFDWWTWTGNAVTKKPLIISLLDSDAKKKVDLLLKEYPSLKNHCVFKPIKKTIKADGFLGEQFFQQNVIDQGITNIYICFASENLSFRTAVHFRQNIIDQDIPIIFRTVNAKDYNNLFESITKSPAIYKNLHAFPLISCDCCLDRLFYHGIEERLAMNIHHHYCANERRRGKKKKDNPSLIPWSELTEDMQGSNRRQARDIPKYLKKCNCKIVPLCDWDSPLFRFSHTEVEILAKLEHENYKKYMESLGWTYAPPPKNSEKKTNPTLVSWALLEKEVPGEQEKDRDAIRSIPRLYAEIGWRVIKNNGPASEIGP